MTQVTLAAALLRRKELNEKVALLKKIKETDYFYQIRAARKSVTEGLDNLDADFPKLTVGQVTQEYDFYARQLREIDAVIQHTNWTTQVDIGNTMQDYIAPSK